MEPVEPGDPPTIVGPSAVCVLVEGSYFHGVAVLLNSLIRHGFVGEMVIGYRGTLPPWLAGLPGENQTSALPAAPGISLRLVEIERGWHLTNLKAQFMQRILEEFRPDLGALYFFDADLLINRAWSNFERWVRHGVVLVLDMAETYMPSNHVFRQEWAALAGRCGLQCRPVSGYVNGGCVGVSRAHVSFVRVWARLMNQLQRDGLDMTKIVAPDGLPEYAKMDQDVLNATIMATDVPLALLGQEAMDLFPSARIMTHYMIFQKPWLRRYVLDAIKGFPPNRNEWRFWELVNNPVCSMPPRQVRNARLRLGVARIIGYLRRTSLRE